VGWRIWPIDAISDGAYGWAAWFAAILRGLRLVAVARRFVNTPLETSPVNDMARGAIVSVASHSLLRDTGGIARRMFDWGTCPLTCRIDPLTRIGVSILVNVEFTAIKPNRVAQTKTPNARRVHRYRIRRKGNAADQHHQRLLHRSIVHRPGTLFRKREWLLG
jgi:hypothetical protein